MTSSNLNSILIVDDDEIFRTRLCRAFRERGFDVADAANAPDAIQKASARPARAVVDLRLAEHSGLEVIQRIKESSPETSVVMLTGYGSIATALEAVRLGACNYVTKPADADEILAAFETEPGAAPLLARSRGARSAPTLARAEWEHIQRILSDCGGNITHAAGLLGIPRRSLQRKLGKYPPKC